MTGRSRRDREEAALGAARIVALVGCVVLAGTVAAGVVYHGYRAAGVSGWLEERRERLAVGTAEFIGQGRDAVFDLDGLRLERKGTAVSAVASDPTACNLAARALSQAAVEVSGAGATYSGQGLETYRAGGKGASGYPPQEICNRVAYPATLSARMPPVPRG